MTDQFVKYDGTQWSLGTGNPGPRGPAGPQGPEGPPGTTDGFSTVLLGALTSPGNVFIQTFKISAVIFTGGWSTGSYNFQLGEDGIGFTFGNLLLDLSQANFGVGVTFTFQLGFVGATVTLPNLNTPYYMLLWDSAGTYKAIPLASHSGTGPTGLIVDADVDPSAAIQGTKIVPNFGNQEVITQTNMLATAYDLYPIRIPTDGNTTICWTFNETTLPFANSGVGGSQSLIATPSGPGIFGTGLFSGGFNLNGELATSSDTPLTLSTTNATLSCWVNLNSLSGGPIIAKKYDNTGTHTSPFDAIAIYLDQANTGKPMFRITIAGANTDILVGIVLSTGAWHHLGCTWDGTNFNCYVDGTINSVNALGTGTTAIDFGTNGTWFLGQYVSGDGIPNLTVDDVRAESTVRNLQYFIDIYNSGVNPQLATSLKAGDIFMDGDIGGNAGGPTVTGLQNHPIKNVNPSNGNVLTWVGTDGMWEPVAPAGGGGFSSNYFSHLTPTAIAINPVTGQNQNSTPHAAFGDCMWVGTLVLQGSGNIYCSFSANAQPGGYNGLTYALTLLSGGYTVNGNLPTPGILTAVPGSNIGLDAVTDLQYIKAYTSSNPQSTISSTIISPTGLATGSTISVVLQIWDIDGDPNFGITIPAHFGSFIIAEI